MLKNSLDQAGYDGLADVLKSEYVKTGDVYTLQHDEPAGELKRARDREKQTASDLAAQLNATKTQVAELEKRIANTPTVDALKAQVESEYAPVKTALQTREQQLTKLVVESAATKLAIKIGGEKNADALMPHVEKRLASKLDGDMPTVIVRDATGKDSALSIDDLEKELRADTRLSSLVIVNKSSGGAGRQVTGNSPASGAGNVNLATMSPDALVAHLATTK